MGRSYFEVLHWASSFLEKFGKEGYSVFYVFLARKGWSKTEWLLQMKNEISKEEIEQIKHDLELLKKNYPAQYIIGNVEFYGQVFSVTEATLIPRPETEELVDCCLKENKENQLTIVDVGTGTGAIAISLKLARPNWRVMAVDISTDALIVAEKNARTLNAEVQLIQGDGLQPILEPVDILISNPPYISENEWEEMDESVRLFEPKKALFAEKNGLAIYYQLAEEAKNKVSNKGKIYLEIGYRQGQAVKEIFSKKFPTWNIEVRKDLSGKDRMVVATSPNE